VYLDDGQGTVETCRDVLNKIATVSDIKLDTRLYTYVFLMHGTMNLKYKIFPDIVNEM
jgi:hypothetical protein